MTKSVEFRIGDGTWTVVLGRDQQLTIISGLDLYQVAGDRLVIDGDTYRLSEISDRWVCESGPS